MRIAREEGRASSTIDVDEPLNEHDAGCHRHRNGDGNCVAEELADVVR